MPRGPFVILKAKGMADQYNTYWDGFDGPEPQGEGSRRAGKQWERLPLTIEKRSSDPEGLRGQARSPMHPGTRKPSLVKTFQSTVEKLQKEVDNLNTAFNTSIEYIQQGVKIGKQAFRQKTTLNGEFNAFLELLKKEGLS